MSIQRYDCTNGGAQWCQGCYTMTPDSDGDYVEYADHLAALTAERERADRAEKAAAHFNKLMCEWAIDAENLTAERAALRERADTLQTELDRRHGIGGELIIARRERDELHERLRELVDGLERTNWSSWQTTAHFWTQLEAARTALEANEPAL